ncbi:MAG: alpha/beta hydrolase [Clostridia bacterium]|nr:alpha/beta hydrolase [Clostridia bacterium]
MLFKALGQSTNPAVLFFHAMGVVGDSSEPVARVLAQHYFCIMPTSTVYCPGQKYVSKADELRQMETFLKEQGITRLALVVASSIGADLAVAFLSQTKVPVDHVFIDGGQFAQIGSVTRHIMVPFLYLAIKSLYRSKGKTLKKIMWCDDDNIKPYFITAGQGLTYGNIHRQMGDSLVNAPLPALPESLQAHCFFEFGSKEDHFKYRDAVMKAYPKAHYPVFRDYDHMQYQIRDPKGFAQMLLTIMKKDAMPELDFLQ